MNENEQFIFCTNSVAEFNFIAESLGDIETGIMVDGETKIDDKTSVVTEKEIPFSSPSETKKNYVRVLEMRDLTPEEETIVAKAKDYLRRVYQGIFKGKTFYLAYTLSMATLLILHISTANFVGIFTSIASALLILGPKRLITEIVKLATLNKRREKLSEYLKNEHLLGICDLVDNDEDIKLYIKKR